MKGSIAQYGDGIDSATIAGRRAQRFLAAPWANAKHHGLDAPAPDTLEGVLTGGPDDRTRDPGEATRAGRC